jgi:hypothetical protein
MAVTHANILLNNQDTVSVISVESDLPVLPTAISDFLLEVSDPALQPTRVLSLLNIALYSLHCGTLTEPSVEKFIKFLYENVDGWDDLEHHLSLVRDARAVLIQQKADILAAKEEAAKAKKSIGARAVAFWSDRLASPLDSTAGTALASQPSRTVLSADVLDEHLAKRRRTESAQSTIVKTPRGLALHSPSGGLPGSDGAAIAREASKGHAAMHAVADSLSTGTGPYHTFIFPRTFSLTLIPQVR